MSHVREIEDVIVKLESAEEKLEVMIGQLDRWDRLLADLERRILEEEAHP